MVSTCKRAWTVALLMLAAVGAPDARVSDSHWRVPAHTRATLSVGAIAVGEGYSHAYPQLSTWEMTQGDYTGFILTPQFGRDQDLCTGSYTIAVAGSAGVDQRSLASWLIESRLVSMEDDRITFDLRWTRYVGDPRISPSEPLTVEQQLVLRDGDHGVLDLVRSKPSPNGCDSLAVTYEVHVEGPTSLEQSAVAYDLWMVQEDADGQFVSQPLRVSQRQDRKAEYFFAPLGYTKTGQRVATSSDVQMNVWGTLQGRVREDGDIDLTVVGQVGLKDDRSGFSSIGRTLVTVSPGETIDMALDVPQGKFATLGEAASVFGRQRTTIRVTVRRLW